MSGQVKEKKFVPMRMPAKKQVAHDDDDRVSKLPVMDKNPAAAPKKGQAQKVKW